MSIQSYRSLEIGITDLIILFGPGPNKKIGPDRIVTETVKGPFSWTDGLGPVRSTEDRSVFVVLLSFDLRRFGPSTMICGHCSMILWLSHHEI